MTDIKDSTFYGKRIGDMSRDELFDVIESLSKSLEEDQESHHKTLDMWKYCNKARRNGRP